MTDIFSGGGDVVTTDVGGVMTSWAAIPSAPVIDRWSLDWYLSKIPPLHAGDARFMVEILGVLAPFGAARAFLDALPQAFDLDIAIGVQLDAVGLRVGVSREVPVPVMNPWFSWDTPGLGWDQGWWQGAYDGVALSKLDDDTFRRLIRARIVANTSNGTLTSVQTTLDAYFGSGVATVVDETDFVSGSTGSAVTLRISIVIAPNVPTVVDLSILGQELIRVRPAATEIAWAITTVAATPVFGFDLSTSTVAGWDTGAWGADPATVIATID